MLLHYLPQFLWIRDLRNTQLAILALLVPWWLQLEQLGTGQTPLCSCLLRASPGQLSAWAALSSLMAWLPPGSLIFTC